MTRPPIPAEDGAALWRRIAAAPGAPIPDGPLPDAPLPDTPASGTLAPEVPEAAAVERFVALASPVLADHLLGPGAVDPARVAQSRLNNRHRLSAEYACLDAISAAGVRAVAIKGFALGHTIYPAPELRAVGDIDILVAAGDRDRLIAHLAGLGYTFVPLPRPAWGFISEASYAPFVSPDGVCNLDLHVHPDCYPAYLSLTAERVFAAARTIRAGGRAVLVPSTEHAFLLCATNAAKDKFGAFAARKIADAMRLAATREPDWDAMAALARAGRFHTPYRVFLRLLLDLGVAAGRLPADAGAPLPARIADEYARMLDETRRLYPGEPGLLATLRRELTLSTEPAVGLRNAWSRLRGLVAPGTGVPAMPAHR